MSQIHFTAIIPTYNRSHFLERAILSVWQQSLPPLELIIVDDGSTDNTTEVVENIIHQAPFPTDFIQQKNLGVSAARNHAARLAQGDWLAFLDSDDVWLPKKLEKQSQLAQSTHDFKIIHSNEKWLRNQQHLNQHKKHRKSGGRLFSRSLELCLISPSAVILKKDFFTQLGGFREDFVVCEDYDLWLKASCLENIGFIDDVLIEKHGGHSDQLSEKYVAMDYWRVRAIYDLLGNSYYKAHLSDKEIKKAHNILQKKCRILLKGYQKHNNMQNYDEISALLKNSKNLGKELALD